MKITRRGSSADHGESSIELNAPTITWSSASTCIWIKQNRVRDFSTDSRHNYTLRLSLYDIGSLIQAISDAAIANPELFEKELEKSIKPVVRLQSVLAGLSRQSTT
jgi:hypothetical protein